MRSPLDLLGPNKPTRVTVRDAGNSAEPSAADIRNGRPGNGPAIPSIEPSARGVKRGGEGDEGRRAREIFSEGEREDGRSSAGGKGEYARVSQCVRACTCVGSTPL